MRRRANGEGTKPRQRKDGRWVADVSVVYPDGERKRISVYGDNAAECRDKVLLLRAGIRDRTVTKPNPDTVSAFLERWFADIATSTLRPKTVRGYKTAIKTVITPMLGNIRLQNLMPADLQKAVAGDPAARGARQRQLAYQVMHSALDRALKWGMVARNIAEAVEKPRVRKRDMLFFTPAQVREFLAASSQLRQRAFFMLLIFTGIRPGEAYALEWPQVDLDAGKITITHTLDAKTMIREEVKTKRSRRTIDIGKRIVGELRAHRARMLKEGHPHGLVFATEDGKALRESNVTKEQYFPIFKRMQAAEDALAARERRDPEKIARIRMYDLRHTAATLMIAAGTHVKVISERMGHASVAFTMDVYGHLLPTLGADTAMVLEQYLPPIAV
jgi:integrase